MNVLSLFDGMSCGQQALERLGIKVDKYFASEIDKYAIQVTMANYPNTIQLGSVVNVDGYKLPKIDLLIGGSPCQSFSFAGKRKGMATKDEQEILTLEHYLELKEEGYEFEGQSYLFWEYMRLLNECKPTYFLLENVEMGEKWETVLKKAIGVQALHINSALVSAQNRKRIYFTNIGLKPSGLFGDLESIIQQPKDRGILLRDVLETEVDEKYFLSGKMLGWLDRHAEKRNVEVKKLDGEQKSATITSSALMKGNLSTDYIIHNTMPRSSTTGKGGTGPLSRNDGKTYCLDTGNTNAIEIIVASRGRNPKNPKSRISGLETEQQLEPRYDGKTNCLTSVQKDNLVMQFKYQNEIEKSLSNEKATTIDASYYKGFGVRNGACRQVVKQISTNNKSNGGTQPYQQDRIYDIDGISPALQVQLPKGSTMINTSRIRRLTPLECMRLQTVDDNYLMPISDSQKYKMLGNGWTISVIAHIFSYINNK
jgi:DNA (cytosine-5)-methyltransferase 3A